MKLSKLEFFATYIPFPLPFTCKFCFLFSPMQNPRRLSHSWWQVDSNLTHNHVGRSPGSVAGQDEIWRVQFQQSCCFIWLRTGAVQLFILYSRSLYRKGHWTSITSIDLLIFKSTEDIKLNSTKILTWVRWCIFILLRYFVNNIISSGYCLSHRLL